MAEGDALQQAKTQVAELLEAARTGAIIPVRLPGQIEAILETLNQAEEEQAKQLAAAQQNAMPGDVQEVLKEQSAFISHAVHELRTPVTSIRGYSDMLNTPAMGELNDMQKQFLDVIRTNTRRMESLLTDVSYIFKIRAGTLRANEKMDMFKNIAMAIEKGTRPIAEDLKRQLEFVVPDGLPLLNIDSDMLTNAINKMVENGLRYSAEGEGKVTVSASGENNVLKITVSDNGIGMTPEEVNQLGTMYFRSDNDLVREYKGSGLGIPIAYGLIRLVGGSVAVESTPGQGTTFTVSVKGMS